MFTRDVSPTFTPGEARALKWESNNRRNNDADHRLVNIRKQLDNTTATHVMWTPYGPPAQIPPPSYYHGCLRFMDIVEAYMPDRVARQFGRVQGIPPPPITLGPNTVLADKAAQYKKDYGHIDDNWYHMAQHSYAPEDLGREARIAGQTTSDYDQWYVSITHPRVHNPAHGDAPVFLGTQHTSMQPMRDDLFSLSQQAAQDPNVPEYYRAALENIANQAGTGGYPGVQPTPMHNWWGQGSRYPQQQYTQPVHHDWTAYPTYPYANPNLNREEEDSE